MKKLNKLITLRNINNLQYKLNIIRNLYTEVNESLEYLYSVLSDVEEENGIITIDELPEEEEDTLTEIDLQTKIRLAEANNFVACDIDMTEVMNNKNWIDECCK